MKNGFSLIQLLVYIFCLSFNVTLFSGFLFKVYSLVNSQDIKIDQYLKTSIALDSFVKNIKIKSRLISYWKGIDVSHFGTFNKNKFSGWFFKNSKLFKKAAYYNFKVNKWFKKSSCLVLNNCSDLKFIYSKTQKCMSRIDCSVKLLNYNLLVSVVPRKDMVI